MDDSTRLIVDKINSLEKKVDRHFVKTDLLNIEQIRQDERIKAIERNNEIINSDNKLNKKIFIITPVTIILGFALTYLLGFLSGG